MHTQDDITSRVSHTVVTGLSAALGNYTSAVSLWNLPLACDRDSQHPPQITREQFPMGNHVTNHVPHTRLAVCQRLTVCRVPAAHCLQSASGSLSAVCQRLTVGRVPVAECQWLTVGRVPAAHCLQSVVCNTNLPELGLHQSSLCWDNKEGLCVIHVVDSLIN